MFKTEVCAGIDWICQTFLGTVGIINELSAGLPWNFNSNYQIQTDRRRSDINNASNSIHEFFKDKAPYKEAFDAAEFVLDVAMLADGVNSIVNMGKNIPGKFSVGQLSLDGMGVKIPVLCVEGSLAIATVGEVTSIAAAGGVIYKATFENSGTRRVYDSKNASETVNKNLDSDLLDNTGKFKDDNLQTRYDDYCKRKKDIGEKPRDPLEWKEASEKWTRLREQGQVFSDESFAKFSQEYSNAEREITIVTNEGTKVRVNAIATDKDGNIIIQEYKSSETAPYTINQERGFPELQRSGGKVVGKGKGQFTEGYEIPIGSKIETIRP